MNAPVRSNVVAELAALPRVVWVLSIGSFVNRFGSFVVPFLMLWLTGRGVPVAEAGLAIGAWGVGHIGAAVAGGWLADTFGRSRTIALSMGSGAVSMLVLSQMTSVPAIAAIVFAVGFTSELYRPAAGALIADAVPAERRVIAFALYRLTINLGHACGFAIGGVLAQRSFEWLFYADAATSLAFGALAFLMLPASRAARAAAGSDPEEPFVSAVLARPAFLWFMVASTLVASVLMQTSSTLALHVTAVGMTPTDFGFLMSVNGALVFLLEVPLSGSLQRFPARRVIALGFVLTGLGFAATGLATSFLPLVATIVCWTLGEIAIAPVSSAYVAEISPPHLRGRFMGAWGLTWSVGLAVGPALGSWAYATSPRTLWISSCVACLAAAALLLRPVRG